MAQTGDIGSNSIGGGSRGMYLKQHACDVCRGTIVSPDRENNNGAKQNGHDVDELERLDGEVEFADFDSLAKRALLPVSLPQAYAEAVMKRRSAYENWQKNILVSKLQIQLIGIYIYVHIYIYISIYS